MEKAKQGNKGIFVITKIVKRKDDVFAEFRKILEPFDIIKFYSDNWRSYSKYLNPALNQVRKKNTQIIECKNPTLRPRIKRLARKTIGF